MEEITQAINTTIKAVFNVDIQAELTRPAEQFGDYATNVALQLAQRLKKGPKDVAEQLVRAMASPAISKLEVAGPGFINIFLTDDFLSRQALHPTITQSLKDSVVVAEYSDPNPFKVLHAGHLYTSVIGEAIARLLEAAGATVHRVNFGGDVGLHVAKTMWAILQEIGGELPKSLDTIAVDKRADWLSDRYVAGNTAYGIDEKAKSAIIGLNKRVYDVHATNDHDSAFAEIYWTCRQWSYDYFDQFYESIGTSFEKYYPESQTAPIGVKIVEAELKKGVYQKSDGAIVFKGEQYGLHTRVFINSQGLPTYETKDVGLIMAKWQDYHFDQSVVITGNDIVEYMKVVLKSIEQFEPKLVQATTHLTHGIVKLKGGQKMSSRQGNILRAVDVLNEAARANQAASGKTNQSVELGAVKYAFLKPRLGADVIYDPEDSVSLQGNSGPYLQYAHARARSILSKAGTKQPKINQTRVENLEEDERSLVRKMSEYSEVVDKAVKELMPHHVCTYLYELAQAFNRFYEANRVIDDKRQDLRLSLVYAYAQTLKHGLALLNIDAPEKI